MMGLKFGKSVTAGPYIPGRTDLEQMPETPTRAAHHRRAHYETFFRYPELDDMLVDGVFADLVFHDEPPPPLEQPEKSKDTKCSGAPFKEPFGGRWFFYGLNLDGPPPVSVASEVETRPRHRHSNSMDEYSSATSFEAGSHAKKAMDADKLAELALIDPKRAQRIIANRQSAARSKERKTCYTNELERKVQTLQAEATALSAQMTVLQRDTTGLTVENKELKLKLQAREQQAHLRDALNEALRSELQWLKITAGSTF